MSNEEPTLSAAALEHISSTAAVYDAAPDTLLWPSRAYRQLLAVHYRYLIPPDASVLEVGCGGGQLLAELPNRDVTGVDISQRQLDYARARLPHGVFVHQAGETLSLGRRFDIIILSDTLNFAADVHALLERLQPVSEKHTRLIVNFQSQLWRPLLQLATMLGLKTKQEGSNWLTGTDIASLAEQSDWQIICRQAVILFPIKCLGLERIVNRYIAPFLPFLCLSVFLVARPLRRAARSATVSIVIPARNEAGNIEAAVQRTPEMGAWTELIFVEGNSTDQTWAAIQRIKVAYPEKRIKILQQSGKGKGNAVRDGFAVAEGEILMILDADLTMPPEELPKFYHAIAANRAELANGSRLVYPMEKRAMQFLNMCANKAFGLSFSWLLGQSVKDTLCGTKVIRRSDYDKVAGNRKYFGDFDPFGDFDLLFGASKLNLKIVDIPIR